MTLGAPEVQTEAEGNRIPILLWRRGPTLHKGKHCIEVAERANDAGYQPWAAGWGTALTFGPGHPGLGRVADSEQVPSCLDDLAAVPTSDPVHPLANVRGPIQRHRPGELRTPAMPAPKGPPPPRPPPHPRGGPPVKTQKPSREGG